VSEGVDFEERVPVHLTCFFIFKSNHALYTLNICAGTYIIVCPRFVITSLPCELTTIYAELLLDYYIII